MHIYALLCLKGFLRGKNIEEEEDCEDDNDDEE